jgi:hypothetical protein
MARKNVSASVRFISSLFLLSIHFRRSTCKRTTKSWLPGHYISPRGCACHSDPKGTQHAGGRAFSIPFGTVYSTNLTADKETGLGDWTDQQISDAMTKGIRRDGNRILPVMPYAQYSGMAQEDLKALVAFLRTLKPVKKPTPELQTSIPLLRNVAAEGWLKTFGKFFTSPATAPKNGIERGKYLTDHVAICVDCHTTRSSIGVPNRAMSLAGAGKDIGPQASSSPISRPITTLESAPEARGYRRTADHGHKA